MSRPILTLTTDFGLDDHYVGTMKGVILGICPDAQIVDISHGVRPFAIAEGAYTIAQAWRYFPPRTVHVVVVDPGVGTSRRPILVEAGGQFFIGPDNGVLSMVDLRERATVRLIANERFFRHPVSRTFHGRDIFSPVGAHLASGVAPAEIGETIEDYLKPDFVRPRREDPRTWTGQVLKVDHFGNIITNFHVDEFADLGRFRMSIGAETIDVLARNYAECEPGELFAIVGSSGYYEVSVAQGSAAAKVGCEAGAAVTLQL
jgi:S-adenosyl-L-methionine hydrolase (adenosine-forming)